MWSKEKKREYYRKNKAILSGKKKVYYQNNKERIKVQAKKYRDNHKEQHKQYCREYVKKNKLKVLFLARTWHLRNKQQNNEKSRLRIEQENKVSRDKYRARARVYYKKLRGKVCVNCGYKINLVFHHTNYKRDEGITVCRSCHGYIHKWGE